MKFCEKAECMLTVISVINVAIMTAIGLTEGLNLTELCFIAMQIAAIAAVYFYTRYGKPQAPPEADSEQLLKLEAHERTHEQKRHYQVALALMELGEQEKAVSYIEKIMQEIA